jgi:hypothetical protein
MSKKISVLFAETDGVYFNDDRIDPWDIKRNAMLYKGNKPVIAHPPCKRWGRYWSGGPSSKTKLLKGDDNNMFAHSLWVVRTFGGIIEHPEASHAWSWFGLNKPPKKGEWVKADNYGGLTCCVEQGHYGHKARKATWLYINKIKPIELKWGSSGSKMKMELSPHSKEQARLLRSDPSYKPMKRLTPFERLSTPKEFKELLIKMIIESTEPKESNG